MLGVVGQDGILPALGVLRPHALVEGRGRKVFEGEETDGDRAAVRSEGVAGQGQPGVHGRGVEAAAAVEFEGAVVGAIGFDALVEGAVLQEAGDGVHGVKSPGHGVLV